VARGRHRSPGRHRRPTGSLSRLVGPEAETAELRAAGTRLLRLSLGRVRGAVLVLVLVGLVSVAATLLMPAALAAAVDAALSGRGLSAALLQLGVLFGVLILADLLDDLVGAYVGSAMTARMRHLLVDRAFTLWRPGRQPFPAGDLLSRLAVNAENPSRFLPVLLSAVTTLVVSLGGVVGLALIDWRLAVTFLLGVPAAVVMVRSFLSDATEPFLRYQQVQAGVVGRLLDAFAGRRTIRASGTLEQEVERVLQPLPELRAAGEQVWALQGRATWRLTLLTPVLQVLVLSVGGFALSTGDISPGQFLATASYVALALGALDLADALLSVLGCQVGAGRVAQVLDAEPSTPPPASPVTVPEGPLGLQLRGVTVRADDGRRVLDALDLSVPPGATVALVGPSGAGKSLVVALVGRLLDPDEGEVLVGGVPVRRMAPPELRRTVTYAFERPARLGATVHDTIAYARSEASRAQVVAAAAAARADDFVRRLPEGYDTPIATAPMSGGELQRLGLARALLAEARVVVLDDAMSSLDTATEVEVTAALERLLAGRTSLVVAHRTGTAARADLVAWLDAGRVRALAPHRDLWADRAYREVFAAEPAPQGIEAVAAVGVGVGT
jgi:ATP-binding cassette subfamily B protein